MNKILSNVADALLFIFVALPAAAIVLVAPYCDGWNEGSMQGTCSPALFEGIYNTLGSIFLIFWFGGFQVWLPAVLIIILISILAKWSMYSEGYRWERLSHRVGILILPLSTFIFLRFVFQTFGEEWLIVLFGW